MKHKRIWEFVARTDWHGKKDFQITFLPQIDFFYLEGEWAICFCWIMFVFEIWRVDKLEL